MSKLRHVCGIGLKASYGITTHEIKDTILWVCKLPCLPLGTLEPASLNLVLGVLEPDQNGTELHLNESARVAILADPVPWREGKRGQNREV